MIPLYELFDGLDSPGIHLFPFDCSRLTLCTPIEGTESRSIISRCLEVMFWMRREPTLAQGSVLEHCPP